MKIIRLIFVLIAISTLPFFYSGCDDSGITGNTQTSNFASSHLPHLNPEDGVLYELFVSFNTTADHNSSSFISMGKFNINATGQPVDTAGNVVSLKFNYTPDLSKAADAIVTMEPLIDNDTLPNGPRIIGGAAAFVNGVLTFNMDMNYVDVLNSIPSNLGDSARYILATPTDSTTGHPQFYRGVWFTKDSMGQASGISSPVIPDSMAWSYHAWIVDVTNPGVSVYYNIGRFTDPNTADDNSQCEGTLPGYSKPGQDFISTASGCTNIANLNLGNFRLMVTLEPKNWLVQSKPAPIQIFYGVLGAFGYAIPSAIPNVSVSYLPTAVVTVSNNSQSK